MGGGGCSDDQLNYSYDKVEGGLGGRVEEEEEEEEEKGVGRGEGRREKGGEWRVQGS